MFKDFFAGIQSYGKAFRTISEMRLWGYLLAPGLISILLAGAIGAIAWGLAGSFGAWLIAWYPFEWGAAFLNNIAGWLGGILIGLTGFILYKHIVMVIVSPFMSPLSQKVEERLNGQSTPYSGFKMGKALKDLSRGLYIALRNVFRELFYVALLFVLGFIPVVGMISAVLIFLVQAYYAGAGNLDYLLERHYSVKGSVKFVKNNRWLAIGNGTVFMLLLMTGIGFLIAPPLATIAATLEGTKRLSPATPSFENPVEDLV